MTNEQPQDERNGLPSFGIRYDLRVPDATPAERARYLDSALDQIVWAERLGFRSASFSEHHGSPDGYLPSPIVLAAAAAVRTSAIRINISALIAPLHDPLRLAEDLAVVDLLSRGRLVVTIGAGYVPSEFEMFGRNLAERGALVEQAVETLKLAWTGEPFSYRGRTVRVTPTPFAGRPPILLGGQTRAAARRAARIADGFAPVWPSVHDHYREAVVELGRPDPGPMPPIGPRFSYISNDPERAWSTIGAACLHESNAYAAWARLAGLQNGYDHAADVDDLKASGQYVVLTPAECVSLCRSLGSQGMFIFHPLAGGLDPEVAWESLELFESAVLPRLTVSDESREP